MIMVILNLSTFYYFMYMIVLLSIRYLLFIYKHCNIFGARFLIYCIIKVFNTLSLKYFCQFYFLVVVPLAICKLPFTYLPWIVYLYVCSSTPFRYFLQKLIIASCKGHKQRNRILTFKFIFY